MVVVMSINVNLEICDKIKIIYETNVGSSINYIVANHLKDHKM
jgi:hypothetical protein